MKKYEYNLDLERDSERATAQMLKLVGKGKRVLEVGCASGSQTRILSQELSCEVTGLEIDADAAESARPYCNRLFVGNVETVDLKELLGNQKFDVITLGDVLEHLRDPRMTLERLGDFVADTGFLLASIPNIAHASVAFELCHGRFDYKAKGLLDDTHIRFFTRRSVVQTFETAGFAVVRLDTSEVRPEYTEFETKALNSEQQAVLDYIKSAHPDSMVYQFIVQAVPLKSSGYQLSSLSQIATDRIRDLELKVRTGEQRLGKIQAEIEWLEGRFPARFLRAIRRLFKP